MTPLFNFSPASVAKMDRADAARALAQDLGDGGLAVGLVDAGRRARARVRVREPAAICGAPWAEAALRQVDSSLQNHWNVTEGGRAQPDQVLLEVEGPARSLLSAERTALNFLQLLSAAAQEKDIGTVRDERNDVHLPTTAWTQTSKGTWPFSRATCRPKAAWPRSPASRTR